MYRSHDADGRPNYELMLKREALRSSGASAATHNSE
jgi:hypothetical protein